MTCLRSTCMSYDTSYTDINYIRFWHVNSGATSHLCSNKNFFKTINYKHEADILMPDGQKMPPTGMKAKMAKKPFPKKSESKIGKILSLIHTDNVWSNANYNSRRKRS